MGIPKLISTNVCTGGEYPQYPSSRCTYTDEKSFFPSSGRRRIAASYIPLAASPSGSALWLALPMFVARSMS